MTKPPRHSLWKVISKTLNKKAVALFSGGLDSVLTVRLMLDQGIDVTALHFDVGYLLSPEIERGEDGADKAARRLGVALRRESLGADYIRMLMNPKFGYGKGVNPCMDCHIWMIKRARRIMEEIGASFIVSGEVLGQRPMSQRRDALEIIDRETQTRGILLRPLSAKCFDITEPEKNGVVDREKLQGIYGRSRKIQMDLAKNLGIEKYESPGGGCMFTDLNYAKRVRALFARKENPISLDFKILRLGRALKLSDKTGVVIGRDQEENEILEGYRDFSDAFIVPVNFKGPSAAILGCCNSDDISLVGRIIRHYGKKPEGIAVLRSVVDGRTGEFEVADPFPESDLSSFLL